ncbi:MAG: ribonuclease domain-containing protein, partial [Verrucomicrobiota bacterium]
TVTVFSGGTSAAEYTVTAAAGSAWTVPPAATVQHVRGPDLGGGTKGLLYSLRNGLPKFNRYNGRGDVVAQSDIDGTTTWAASYQADGRRTAETGTNVERHRANTKEEDPTGLLNEGFRYRDMETGTFISRDPLGHVDGPNVYCYVGQNPWTMWDPEGLETVAQHTANAEWAAKNGKYLDMLACTFMGFGRAINPADAKSELRNASAQMPALVDNARKEINNSSIPAPLKIVAKAALATAGNAEPLQLLEGGVQVKNTVHTHGLGAAAVMLDGIKKAASEDPVYFVSQLTSGFLMGGGGKILSKPGSGVLAAKTPLALPAPRSTFGSSLSDVSKSVFKNGSLPDNFITKAEAKALGWNPKAGNLDAVAPGKSIGGDVFGNKEGLLPSAPGRTWFEADLNYSGGYRGGERLLYSNDGKMFYSGDHYKTFQQIGN